MKTKSKLGQWLGVLTMGTGLALCVGSSASASTIPSEEVTVVVSDAATGNTLAGGTFDSGIHTGPSGTTPPFSPNSTQITTGFTGAGGLGGVTMSGGQHTADNNYPDITSSGLSDNTSKAS